MSSFYVNPKMNERCVWAVSELLFSYVSVVLCVCVFVLLCCCVFVFVHKDVFVYVACFRLIETNVLLICICLMYHILHIVELLELNASIALGHGLVSVTNITTFTYLVCFEMPLFY